MSGIFSRESKKVELVKTHNRIIKSEIPCKGTAAILEKLDKYESRSMHGQLPLVWDSAYDFNIYDKVGNKFIDFTSAIFFANVGHSNKNISKRILESLEKPIVGCYAYGNEIRAEYIKRLVSFSGQNFEKAFLMSAGTEATEAAFKLMRMQGKLKNKNRLGIIALENNWHGRTLAAQMMSGNIQQKEWVGYHDKDIHHLSFPYPWIIKENSGESFFYEQIKKLENTGINLKKDLCGMMLETFQGWGAIFYPKDFVQAAENFCIKNDIVMTFDEMQSGFARTGKDFGYMHYDVNPHLLCCGKGMGNGYPLSGVVGTEEIMDLPEIGNMSSTHSANPLACSIGIGVLNEIEEKNLTIEAYRKGKIMKKFLKDFEEEYPENISFTFCKGLIAAVLFHDKKTKKPDIKLPSLISEKCMQKGLLLVHTGRESIKIGPPLTITDDALKEGMNVFSETIKECIKDAR